MLNATNEILSLRLAATDLHGNPITQIEQGESFLIKAYIDDRRDEPEVVIPQDAPLEVSDEAVGFFTAYFNVTFDSVGFEFDPTYGNGGVKYGPAISLIDPEEPPAPPSTDIDGYIERLGVSNLQVGGPDEIEALSFRMIAQAPGTYSGLEAFLPHFHFDQVPSYGPSYVNGVPQLQRLTGFDFYQAVDLNDEYFSLQQYYGDPITSDDDVYFEGINLEVIASPSADYEIRFVTTPTTTSGGEVNELPTNVVVIDEWNHFFVEVYAKAPAGNAVQAGFVELNYNTDDFSFVRAVGRTEDPTNLRYSVTSTVVDEENGTVRVGFSSLATNLGDDRYALIGRIQMKSDIELPTDYTNGELTSTDSSEITLVDTNATVYNTNTMVSAVIDGSATGTHSFEVWPVIYDVANGAEDRKVGLDDFAGFIGQYGKLVNDDPIIRKFDFDNSGRVDLEDFSYFIANYGQSDQAPTFRTYLPGYPGDLSGPALMGSSFSLEGEPVNLRTTSQSSTTTAAPTVLPIEGEPSSVSGPSLITTLPLSLEVPTEVASDGDNQEDQVVSPVEETTDVVLSTLDDQTDLIVMSSQDSESSFATEEDEPAFAESADEVLAIWEDENAL